MLSPSHIAYLNIIKTLIECGRNFNEQMMQNNMISLSILIWLDESLSSCNIFKVKQFHNLKSFYDSINSCIPLDSKCNAIERSLYNFYNINSVDDLIDFIDSTRNLFEYDSNLSNNGVPSPTKICNDSSLGIFVRSIHSCWDSMTFGATCILQENIKMFSDSNIDNSQNLLISMNDDPEELYKKFAYKIGTDDSVVDIIDSEDAIDEGNAYAHLLNAMKAIICGDVKTAEGSMHWYFDYSSSNPLTIVPSSSAITGKNLSDAVQLLESCNQPQFGNERHQQAMLTLASTWAHNNHYSTAMLALEEAMKTAHQRGDHISIAKALLVLHEVVLSSQKDQLVISQSNVLPEEVLCRCINRCVELHMRPLASQAAIYLAKLRSQRPLRNNGIGIFSSPKTVVTAINKSKPGIDDNNQNVMEDEAFVTAFSGTDTIQNVWYLLLCAQIGECQLISQVANGTIYNVSPSIHPNSKDNASQDIPLSVEESIPFSIQATIVSSELWMRLGLLEMAQLQCRRAIRQYGIHATSEDFINICCSMAKQIVDIEYSLLKNNHNFTSGENMNEYHRLSIACEFSLSLLSTVKKLFPARFPSILSRTIDYSLMYVKIHQEICIESWDRALEIALRLVEVSSSKNKTNKTSFDCSNPEIAQANILLSNILEHIDIMEAHAIVVQFDSLHDNSGLCQFKFEAAVLKAMISMKLYDNRQLSDVIISLRKMIIISRIQNYPTVEKLATQCLRSLFIT